MKRVILPILLFGLIMSLYSIVGTHPVSRTEAQGPPRIRTLLVVGDGARGCVRNAWTLYRTSSEARHTYGERVEAGRLMGLLPAACASDLHQFGAYCQDLPTCFALPPNFRDWGTAQEFLRSGGRAMQDTLRIVPSLLRGQRPTNLDAEFWVVDLERWHQARDTLVSRFGPK